MPADMSMRCAGIEYNGQSVGNCWLKSNVSLIHVTRAYGLVSGYTALAGIDMHADRTSTGFANKALFAATAATCASICYQEIPSDSLSFCHAWSYVASTQKCYLHYDIYTEVAWQYSPDVTSGTIFPHGVDPEQGIPT